MSILIKGAMMPSEGNWITVCIYPNGKCAVLNRQGGYKNINALEIPPHGGLIDAYEVMKSIKEDYCDSCQYKPTTCHDCHIGDVLYIIANAPTIIESEEQDHE